MKNKNFSYALILSSALSTSLNIFSGGPALRNRMPSDKPRVYIMDGYVPDKSLLKDREATCCLCFTCVACGCCALCVAVPQLSFVAMMRAQAELQGTTSGN